MLSPVSESWSRAPLLNRRMNNNELVCQWDILCYIKSAAHSPKTGIEVENLLIPEENPDFVNPEAYIIWEPL